SLGYGRVPGAVFQSLQPERLYREAGWPLSSRGSPHYIRQARHRRPHKPKEVAFQQWKFRIAQSAGGVWSAQHRWPATAAGAAPADRHRGNRMARRSIIPTVRQDTIEGLTG